MKYYVYLLMAFCIFCFYGCQSSLRSSSQDSPQIEEIQSLMSYENNLREIDIASFFRITVNRYLSNAKYYHVQYTVFYDKDLEGFPWLCNVEKVTFKWGIVYNINLNTPNGIFVISTSNSSFRVGQESSREIITFQKNSIGWGNICQYINDNILAFMNETGIALRKNGLFLTDSVSEAFRELNMLR